MSGDARSLPGKYPLMKRDVNEISRARETPARLIYEAASLALQLSVVDGARLYRIRRLHFNQFAVN
jgi:hypothetical protein